MAKKQTTHEKGLELEQKFSEFMKEELGYNHTRVRAKVPQKHNHTGVEVDVIGKRTDERGKRLENLSIGSLILGGILFFLGLYLWMGSDFDDTWLMSLLLIGIMLVCFSMFYILLSTKFNQENAWVECKNLKGKANITQVGKMIIEIEEYKLSNNKEYKFVDYFFVSTNGFVENAIKKAMDKGISCYSLSNGKFIKEKYWN